MNCKKVCGTGVAGSVVAAICCFTPALVLGLTAVGLSAWLKWADFVLFPALAFFLGLTVYGLLRLRRERAAASGARSTATSETR